MRYLGNSIYLKCFLLLLLFRLVPSVEVLIEAWAMCMISLQEGCIRKSDSDNSNNGTSHLLSVTWLRQEPGKFPAIKFWQVAGNQYNIPHAPCCTQGEKKKVCSISWVWLLWRTGCPTGCAGSQAGFCFAGQGTKGHPVMWIHIIRNLFTAHLQASHRQLLGLSFSDF